MRRRVIPAAVRTARNKVGLSQSRLAHAVDCSPGYIAMIEKDRRHHPSVEILGRIAAVTGVTLDDLSYVEPDSAE